ncbi:MAG: hypothetical protein QOF82_2311 [Frankiales bacterium]|nr:hypothetical protein [Frankiales bacterium]MDX6213224.1 hypothetical protein [Frankiales bacterium]
MAGGMRAPRERLTLAERSELSRAPGPTGPATTARHCWVSGLPDHPGRWPGLLLEWRKVTPTLWQGRVVYTVHDGRQTVLIEAWLSGTCLEPAG